jgi:hypothetical protein
LTYVFIIIVIVIDAGTGTIIMTMISVVVVTTPMLLVATRVTSLTVRLTWGYFIIGEKSPDYMIEKFSLMDQCIFKEIREEGTTS